MADDFSDHSSTLTSPALNGAPITASDSVDLSNTTRAVYVGGAGDVVAVLNGTAVTFTGVAAGTFLPIRATRINSTNTTATNLVALW